MIDINEGDDPKLKYRSRNVAREIARLKRNDLFAATPPLEAIRMIASFAATGTASDTVLAVADIRRAYFYGI